MKVVEWSLRGIEGVKSTVEIKAFLLKWHFQYKLYNCHNICPALCSDTFTLVLIFLYYTTLLSVQKTLIISQHLVGDKLCKSHPLVWRMMYIIAWVWPVSANCVAKIQSKHASRIQLSITTLAFPKYVTHHYIHHKGTDNYARYFT